MKKILFLLVSAMLVASLSHGTFSNSIVHVDCASLLHDTQPAGDRSAELAISTDSEGAGMATTTAETAQQIEEQSVSFPDRIVNIVDTFARLVMVI
ncbi:hypothetical protein [uncultured Pontibacter sp.]|uniref:hypothetical protein n=1 Tax=uncultured Pontibacter sp. TaxID=453356 RepID=UPI00262AEB18|nr:hypothetical protein [uncultured Pontibacter sp.]